MIQNFMMSGAMGGGTAPAKSPIQYIFDGDSITAGNNVGENQDYPYNTWALIQRTVDSYQNIGIGSQLVSEMLAKVNSDVVSRFQTNRRNAVALLGGINDIAALETPASIYADLKAYWLAIRNAGGLIIAATLLPAGTLAQIETDRQALNTLIKSDLSLYDGLIDFGNNVLIGQPGDQDNLTYYLADKVHPNYEGNKVMAQEVDSTINFLT